MAKQSTPAVKAATNDQTGNGSADENQTGGTDQVSQEHEHQGENNGGETGAPLDAGPVEGDGETMRMMVAEQVLVVSAPGGPRRRAGFGFGPVPVDLRWEDLGPTDEKRKDVLKRLRADPMLKIDGRMEERPADD